MAEHLNGCIEEAVLQISLLEIQPSILGAHITFASNLNQNFNEKEGYD
jgi:hypothetical protein